MPWRPCFLKDLALHCTSFAYRPGQGKSILDSGEILYNRWERASSGSLAAMFCPSLISLITYFRSRPTGEKNNSWIATRAAHPSASLKYHLLLISEAQGVGKDTLALIVKMPVGKHNVFGQRRI